MSTLGRLDKIDLRDIWQSEALDFTPWLAQEDNLVLLGETLGIELELEAVEKPVGPFRADILCKDTSTADWVLIENQLERTDHTHLGQLLTYGAGLNAVTIVWISARMADEHRAALDWLNDITDEDVRFFGLEVELWKIGDSPAAPKFNVVSKPNDWSKHTANATKAISNSGLTETRIAQLEYWDGVERLLAASDYRINPVKPQAQSWITHGIGRVGFALAMSMNTRENWVRVELYLSGAAAKGNFDLLEQQRAPIEARLTYPLDWQRLDEKRDARVCFALENTDPLDRADWPRQHHWLIDRMNEFHTTFYPLIRSIDPGLGAAPS